MKPGMPLIILFGLICLNVCRSKRVSRNIKGVETTCNTVRCGANHTLKFCTKNGTDECIPCPNGTFNPDALNSSEWLHYEPKCVKPNCDVCEKDDDISSVLGNPGECGKSEMATCVCDTSLGYYGSVIKGSTVVQCDYKEGDLCDRAGVELTQEGTCARCKEGFMKTKNDRSLCVPKVKNGTVSNKTSHVQNFSHSTTPPLTTSSIPPDKENNDELSPGVLVLIAALIGTFIFMIICIVCIYCYKYYKSKESKTMPKEKSDQLSNLEKDLLLENVDYGENENLETDSNKPNTLDQKPVNKVKPQRSTGKEFNSMATITERSLRINQTGFQKERAQPESTGSFSGTSSSSCAPDSSLTRVKTVHDDEETYEKEGVDPVNHSTAVKRVDDVEGNDEGGETVNKMLCDNENTNLKEVALSKDQETAVKTADDADDDNDGEQRRVVEEIKHAERGPEVTLEMDSMQKSSAPQQQELSSSILPVNVNTMVSGMSQGSSSSRSSTSGDGTSFESRSNPIHSPRFITLEPLSGGATSATETTSGTAQLVVNEMMDSAFSSEQRSGQGLENQEIKLPSAPPLSMGSFERNVDQ